MYKLAELGHATPAIAEDGRIMSAEEITAANEMMHDLSVGNTAEGAMAIIAWTYDRFEKADKNEHVLADTSGGIDSALIWSAVAETDLKIGMTFGDPGILARETYMQIGALMERFQGIELHVAEPNSEDLAAVIERRLWQSEQREDLDEFLEVIKLRPLREQDIQLGKVATIAAARYEQTLDRASLNYIVASSNGKTVRVNPFYKWSQEEVDTYIDDNGLPRNALPLLRGPNAVSHRNIFRINGQIVIVPFDSCGRNSPDERPVHKGDVAN